MAYQKGQSGNPGVGEMRFDRKRRPGTVKITPPASGTIDVRAIRLAAQGSIGGTQQRFADAIGVRVKTLRNWEQRRRSPAGPARMLLSVIERDPWLVFDVTEDQDERFDSYGRALSLSF